MNIRPVFLLTYVSSAIRHFPNTQLLDLLRSCHRNNTVAGVTGMLLYKDGSFMQFLEGEEQIVRNLRAKIARDAWRCGMITLLEGDVSQRQFM